MGNSGSGHQQQVTLVEGPPHSWVHSFPRTTSFKVLPDRVPGQRLRLTDNGAILHNGGTISGRKPCPFEPPTKNYRNSTFQTGQDYRKTLYNSEPDLRYSRDEKPSHAISNGSQTYYNNNNDNSVKSKIGRSRKKYKAPPAPNVNSADSSSPDSYYRWETSADSSDVTTPSRRSRLFKTRAETKRPSVDNAIASKYHTNTYSQMYKPGAVPGQLQRSLSSPQFQDELTAKLRERAIREPPVGKAADSPRSSPVPRNRENVAHVRKHAPKSPHIMNVTKKLNGKAHDISDKLPLNETKAVVEKENLPNGYHNRVSREANRRNNVEEPRNHSKTDSQNGIQERLVSGIQNDVKEPEAKKTTTPVKKFYFGMEAEAQSEITVNGDTNEVVDKFAATLRTSAPIRSNTSPSDSFSSEPTNDDSSVGISLKLRPTLPRKQLDIPRFSPTAAWRLLSALESPIHSEEDDLVLIEDQIPHPHVGHQLADKSGDSGISGDASPQHQDSTHNSQIAWTPQQDLEETSSDGGLDSAPVSPESIGTAKFSPRFSLSLPRDERLAPYSSDKVQPDIYLSSSFQNLKKLKRSVSGALVKNKEVAVSSLDENWLLSRSVPNLFRNSYGQRWSDTSPSSGEPEDDPSCSVSKPPSFSYLANGGHIMYLPEYKNVKHSKDGKITNAGQISKSCEDLTHHQNKRIMDHANNYKESNGVLNQPLTNGGGRAKNRKFTFQSTIRQIERRRIADKLSKEAEEKEKRRLRELEAMKKVEEEFQRKREREKADIRHQLRLYNLTDGGREQPDGAVVPPPAPSTQILSEYRQPRRDYRDYMPIRFDLDSVSHSDSGIKRETVHPEVIFKMPKNTQVYVTPHQNSGNGSNFHSRIDSPKSLSSDNYRKDFAQGALSRSVASSDSELSQPNTRPTSRTKQRSRSPSFTSDEETKNPVEDSVVEKHFEQENNAIEEKCIEKSDNYASNIENLTKIFSTGLQPFNRNKTYKPVSFKPFSDKIAQVTS